MMDRLNADPNNWRNRSANRNNLRQKITSDVRYNNQSRYYALQRSHPGHGKGLLPTARVSTVQPVEIGPIKVIGHYQTDRFGKNLVLDGIGGIRVYNLPVERREFVAQSTNSDIEEIVDDEEQLAESGGSNGAIPLQSAFIPDCCDLDFDLLKGYVPLKYGGNRVSLSGVTLDRTAGMRWMVENHQKLKCNDGSRPFDVDFYAGNGALRSIMDGQFNQYEETAHIAVILFKGTYFVFVIDLRDEGTKEWSNQLSFGGIRFEDYICRGVNGEKSEPSSGLFNNYADYVKYSNVLRFNFFNFKMLVTGNVDCVIPGSSAAIGKQPKSDDFIEIKTSAPLEDKYDPSRMSRAFQCSKTSSWFAQCILMGVKHVVVGIREPNDDCKKLMVKRTRAFTLEELQQHSNGFWSKDQCFDILKKFLCVVKQKVIVDDPEIINLFEIQGGWIRGPQQKSYADDRVRYPDISGVVDLMNKL